MDEFMASSVLAATAPRATMTFGRMAATWRMRNGEQVSHSSRSGVRFCGGRHLMILAIYTASLLVFVGPRRLSDEHQVSLRVSYAEDQVGAPLVQPAKPAIANARPNLLQRLAGGNGRRAKRSGFCLRCSHGLRH